MQIDWSVFLRCCFQSIFIFHINPSSMETEWNVFGQQNLSHCFHIFSFQNLQTASFWTWFQNQNKKSSFCMNQCRLHNATSGEVLGKGFIIDSIVSDKLVKTKYLTFLFSRYKVWIFPFFTYFTVFTDGELAAEIFGVELVRKVF